MTKKVKYVRRNNFHNEIDNFIKTPSSELDGQVMLIVGDQGMGKSALLKGIAKEASDKGYALALGDIDKKDTNFSDQIYPLIAQIEIKKRFKFGSSGNWLKAGFTGLTLAADFTITGGTLTLATGAIKFGELLNNIRNNHGISNFAQKTLAEIFHATLTKREEKVKDEERIIILLDPEKESPSDMTPLFRRLTDMGMPQKVRFIIAQRNKDTLIEEYEKDDLKGVFHEPIHLEMLTDDEESKFVDAYDNEARLNSEVRSAIKTKYKSWPLLLELAITQLLKQEGEITCEDVRVLPSDIRGFWERRYKAIQNENTLKVVHAVSILPHPYPRERLSIFTGLKPAAIAAALNNPATDDLLERVDYEGRFSLELWKKCPYPKHASAKSFIREMIEEDAALKKELCDHIIAHYKEMIGGDPNSGSIDKDALVFLPQLLLYNKNFKEFLSAVNKLGEIKNRYGLFDSVIAEHKIALSLYEKLNNKIGMSSIYGNMGVIYNKRGEWDKAMEMYEKALAINEDLGRMEGMATNYGNMGIIYQEYDELDKAMEMYEKALVIVKKLGDKKGMALNYGNKGVLYQLCGELEKALDMQEKALQLCEEIASKEGMAYQYGNIGITYQKYKELDKAMDMHKKSLALNKEIGQKDGIASNYANMGIAHQALGELEKACKCWRVSLRLYKEIGTREESLSLESWIAENCK